MVQWEWFSLLLLSFLLQGEGDDSYESLQFFISFNSAWHWIFWRSWVSIFLNIIHPHVKSKDSNNSKKLHTINWIFANFIQDEFFLGLLTDDRGGLKAPHPLFLKLVSYTYPTILKLDTIIAYLKNIQKL